MVRVIPGGAAGWIEVTARARAVRVRFGLLKVRRWTCEGRGAMDSKGLGGLALKIGIAGAVGFGALATGMVVSRKGRNLMREAWQGRQRTTLEDRVLDALWDDRTLSRRAIDVEEVEPGVMLLEGTVYAEDEHARCLDILHATKGVIEIVDRLVVERPPRRRRRDQLSEQLRQRIDGGW
jgi:hypothetical protein